MTKKSQLIKNLEQIKNLAEESLHELVGFKMATITKKSSSAVKKNHHDYVPEIVNKIKNFDKAEKVEKEILDKNSMAGKILLPFYICYKYFPDQTLTTGDVEKITGELGVRIKTPNIAKAIKESLLKYLDSSKTRIKGKATPYKLNRRGYKYVEEIINGKS